MSALGIIERALNSGLRLWAGKSGLLQFAGDANTFEQLRPELIAHKAEILEALSYYERQTPEIQVMQVAPPENVGHYERQTPEIQVRQLDAPENEVELWLRQKLDSVQPAASIEAQAVQIGFPLEQINAARLAIGAQVSKCLGVIYWRLVDTIGREAVRDALAKIAAELGFTWSELLDAGLITDRDLDQFGIDFSADDDELWRGYIASLGMRARHSCPGLANRIGCDCAGQCRVFRS